MIVKFSLFDFKHCSIKNLCCRLWLSRPESDPVSALPVYAEIRPRIASRSSAWVMCHSCSIVAWGVGSGTGKQRWWWLWLVTTPLCTYPFEASLIAKWLKCSVSLHGMILLQIRDPMTDMCCVVTWTPSIWFIMLVFEKTHGRTNRWTMLTLELLCDWKLGNLVIW